MHASYAHYARFPRQSSAGGIVVFGMPYLVADHAGFAVSLESIHS
jgi:hypothetical protein